MEYISIKELSEKIGLSKRRINDMCNFGRIEGAKKVGSAWIVPADTEKPPDARIKSGKYINARKKKQKIFE